jgi:hypothetical protein
MKGCGRNIATIMFVLLMALSPASVSGQQTQQRNKKPLPEKQNPLLVGKRNINSHQINFYSVERETALGRQLAAQVEMQLPMVNDPVITEYVNRVGQNLALHSDAKVPFTIKVMASDEVNAFALPGGFLFVNLGVLKVAATESELAGVMAHEIAHVTARHALENLSKNELLSLTALPLIFVAGPIGELGRMGAELGLAAAFFKFSRGAEREADELGAQYLWAAGYDPEALVSFFQKLQSQERRVRVSPLFRSHPTTPDRIKDVQKLIARFPERENYIVNTREFDSIKRSRFGGGGSVPSDVARSSSGGPHPPVLRRRSSAEPSASDEPSSDEDSRSTSTSSSTSAEPSPSIRREDGRQPPKMIRRPSPDSPSGEQLPPAQDQNDDRQNDRRPPRMIRRPSPDSQAGEDSGSPSSEPLPSSRREKDRQPPKMVRRSAPDSQPEGEPPSSQNGDIRSDQPPVVFRRTSSSQQDAQALPRTPPRLRRCY